MVFCSCCVLAHHNTYGTCAGTVEKPWQCARRSGSISETVGSVILYVTLTPGYAMLMSPKQDETAVHGCHFTGTLLCACVKVRPDRGDV